MPTTITLPNGGHATLRAMSELTPRQRRKIKPYAIALASRIQGVMSASTITVDGKVATSSPGLTGPSMAMSLQEAELFGDMQDQTTVALLVAWSLPHPLPTTLDELLDVDDTTGVTGLYDALSNASAKVTAEAMTAPGFGVDSVEVPDSPTGA